MGPAAPQHKEGSQRLGDAELLLDDGKISGQIRVMAEQRDEHSVSKLYM